MHIVVIGGGIGGLAAAWSIHETARARGLAPPQLTVVEAGPTLGGHVVTKRGRLAGSDPSSERWVDLGVNDFNASTYKRMVRVMDRIGLSRGVHYRPLQDSAGYATPDGATAFRDATSGPHAMDERLKASVDDFMATAARDARDPLYCAATIEDYINAKSAEHGWDARLGPLVVYPRINAMYFTSSLAGPRKMPFAAVMHYYRIQEGAGEVGADRCYFVEGAGAWIERLAAFMRGRMGIALRTDFDARVIRRPNGGWRVVSATCPNTALDADLVVFACHANHVSRTAPSVLHPRVAQILGSIRYDSAVAIAHADAGLLSRCRDTLSTYNISIDPRPSGSPSPYRIDYAINSHQNDAAHRPSIARPEIFVSVNPSRPVSPSLVLRDRQGTTLSAKFENAVFDFACIAAQKQLDGWQGHDGVYFAGGWTRGSGLHEECWAQSEHIADLIADRIIRSRGPVFARAS